MFLFSIFKGNLWLGLVFWGFETPCNSNIVECDQWYLRTRDTLRPATLGPNASRERLLLTK